MVGGFLVAAASVGVFAAYLQATAGPSGSWVVAAREVTVGDELEAGDLTLVAVDLPPETAARAFTDPEALGGATALAPISAGELVQASQVTDDGAGTDLEELSFAVDAARAVGGDLRRADRLDLLASYSEAGGVTELVASDVVVLDTGEVDGSIGSSGRLTLTVGIADRASVLAVAHAVSNAELMVVRTTGREADSAAPGSFRPELDLGAAGR